MALCSTITLFSHICVGQNMDMRLPWISCPNLLPLILLPKAFRQLLLHKIAPSGNDHF